MKDLISVIIPVYNAEKYLAKCIESILTQTYEKFELILVDDGAKDNSGKICDEYAAKDERIKVIHKKNGGVSSARNTGIESAKGEFIAFVDSDDWLEENSLEILHREITMENADLAAGAFVRIVRKGRQRHDFKTALYSGDQIAENIVQFIRLLGGTVWAKLFRRDIIINEGLLFNPEIPLGEDSVFLMTYVQFCKKIILKDELVYAYNCMVLNSAVCKFYQDYDKYTACVYTAAKGVVEKSNLDMNEKKRLFYGLANRFCCLVVNYYLTNCTQNEALKKKMREIVSSYEVSTEMECFTDSGTKLFSYDEFVLFAEKNIDAFFELYKRNLLKKSPLRYMKRRLRPALKKLGLIR